MKIFAALWFIAFGMLGLALGGKTDYGPFPVSLRLAAAAIGFSALCIDLFLLRRRKKKQKNTLEAPIPDIFGVWAGGAVFSLPLLWENLSFFHGLCFAAWAAFCFAASVMGSLERLEWDENGFDYRPAAGRKTRYGFEDISWAGKETRTVFAGMSLSSRETGAFRIHLSRRRLILTERDGDILGFLRAYDSWRIERDLPPWQQAFDKNPPALTLRLPFLLKSEHASDDPDRKSTGSP